ncbi:MAG: hypothetical protein H6613_18525 [Ignavibacteriales bacterium]|nr:hypothetical protein [Ignavibacteriales bacterium]
MRKKILLSAIFVILFSVTNFAQLNDYPIKIGIQGSGLLPDTDLKMMI